MNYYFNASTIYISIVDITSKKFNFNLFKKKNKSLLRIAPIRAIFLRIFVDKVKDIKAVLFVLPQNKL